ncbi:MAG: thioredoxin domain-containing protein [Candidatus Kapabacteria bacterium]|nr:thioredoxin domain-containing protein [Candidatus Kapabacteria bacterium]
MPERHDNAPANALANERSPYLRQHAHNPVHWLPWSDEAFARARELDRPVLLSIGYATCHWCHVMAHESFEDADVAAYLNEHYVCIKVDREERPDVDAIYMDVCQGMTGHGGWPLTIVTDGDRRPFFAGTYFPRTSRGNRIGFLELMTRIDDVWTQDRTRLMETAQQITQSLRDHAATVMTGDVPSDIMEHVVDHHRRTFDADYGGFSNRPKFPSPHHLLYLLRAAHRTGDASILAMVTTTLDAMRAGGMYDHVGFGFHRYSTDRQWLLPHFEKMLYDQAMLMMAYAEAWQYTGVEAYRRVVLEIADYVGRCLTSPEGCFMSAQDADSEGEEGKCYVWSYDDFVDHADERLAERFGICRDGNFHDEATGDPMRENIPHLERTSWRAIYDDAEWETVRQRLLAMRDMRVQPITDDKVAADWNGLMIGALARAARALQDTSLREMAVRAFDGLTSVCGAGRDLRHVGSVPAMLDDHAAVGWAAVELYQTTRDDRFLAVAQLHMRLIGERFVADDGTLCTVGADTHDVIVRQKQGYDSAYPCGNSMAALCMTQLAAITHDAAMQAAAEACVQSWGRAIQTHGPGFCMLLCAWDMLVHGAQEIHVHGADDDPFVQQALALLQSVYMPDAVFGAQQAGSASASDAQAHVQWCHRNVCQRPLTSIDDVRMQINVACGRNRM